MNKHIRVRIQQLLALAEASPCPRRKFGAMIYDPVTKALIADGYNGSPRGGGHLCGGGYCVRDGLPRHTAVYAVKDPRPGAYGQPEYDAFCYTMEIDGRYVAPSDSAHPFVPGYEFDPTPRRIFNTKEEALEYEKATRPDGVKSGTKMEEGCHHAEMNAICNAARHGASTEGKWMLVTGEPCKMCAKLIHHAGIVQVVCVNNGYSGANGVKYLEDHGVAVVKVDGPKDSRL